METRGGQGCVPVPAAAGGPNPPDPPDDDDDDGDDDEEEPSDDDDDDHRRNRRSSRRRRSRDRRSRTMTNQGNRGRRLRKSPYLQLDGWKMALTMNITSASADPDVEVWMSWLACAFVVNPDLGVLADSDDDQKRA